jgi:hypothetical protein
VSADDEEIRAVLTAKAELGKAIKEAERHTRSISSPVEADKEGDVVHLGSGSR